MNEDEQLRERFSGLGFADEPPMASTAAGDLARGRRHLRRRRAATLSGGIVGVTALAVGAALALPGGGPTVAENLPVGGGGTTADAPAEPTSDATITATPEVTNTPSDSPTTEVDDRPPAGDEAFWETRQLLLATAVEHLDPAHEHLPAEVNGFTGGASGGVPDVGTKLGWTNEGEDGEGLVRVAVTGPGYTTAGEFSVPDFLVDFGCDLPENCTEETLPGGETVLVAPANPEMNLLFAVSYERADGSMVGVAVYDLFGNNSLTPVSEMDVTLEQAMAFVTDEHLQVLPKELDDELDFGPVVPPEGEIASGESTTETQDQPTQDE